MSKYERYPSYKDSGVKWLKEVPESWEVKNLKYAIDMMQTGTTPSTAELAYYNGDINWFNPTDLNNHILIKSTKQVTDKAILEGACRIFPSDSVLIVGIGATAGKTSYLASVDSSFNQQITGFHSKINYNKYLFYLMKSFTDTLLATANFTTLAILNNDFFKTFTIVMPSLHEQKIIANYLDKATAKIDTLVEKQTKLIELLKEKRQAVISHAVTKGFDPNVKMKDSGVEWLGEIPEQWELSKLRYVFSFSKGLTITKANLVDKGIPCVNYGEIHSKYGFEVDADKHVLKCVDTSYLNDSKSSLLSMGDFVFADTSEDIEGAGNFTHVSSEAQIFAGYHTIIARQVGEHNFRFLAYLIDSEAFRTQIRLAVKGVKVFSITQAILRASIVWLPKKGEQQIIANHLDDKTSKIDNLITKSTKAIDLLKEKRTALISSAVTGKIDVREIA